MILVSILILLLSFYLLAVLTEEFFVPSIDKLAERMKLSSDAAGATLLAAGSSAPEFFTSLIAVLGLAGENNGDVGAGTIVGSAIFNVLIIIGASALFKSVKLQWKPVIRDMLMYSLTVILLALAFLDGKIILIEAIGFVVLYGVYVYVVVHWREWLHYEDQESDVSEIIVPKNKLHILTHKLIGKIVPDVERRPKLYGVTFIISVLIIALVSWVLVEQVIIVADVLHINSVFLALTVLAAGTSIPDLIGSIVVAKQGRGDMAVSNAVGSNVFDILIGLGLPWLIYGIYHGGKEIPVSTDNLLASILLLFATVAAIFFLFVLRNWKIGHKSGLFLIALYCAYVVYIAVAVA